MKTIDELIELSRSTGPISSELNSVGTSAERVQNSILAGIHYALQAQAKIARAQLEQNCRTTREGHRFFAGDKTNTCARCGLQIADAPR